MFKPNEANKHSILVTTRGSSDSELRIKGPELGVKFVKVNNNCIRKASTLCLLLLLNMANNIYECPHCYLNQPFPALNIE